MLAAALRPAPRPGVEWHGSWAPRDPDDAARVAELPAAQRLLLTLDGTFTTALEALAGEPLGVRVLGQHVAVVADDDHELALWAGAKVLERRVLLHGAVSGAPLAHGASRIVTHRLPRTVRDELSRGDVPIGLVLRRHEIETFRAPLSFGIVPASDEAAAHLGPGRVCRRTYAINAGGRPIMVVCEQFLAGGRD